MNQDEYLAVIRRIRDMWPHGTKDWTRETIKSWEPMLADLDATHAVAAILAIASDGEKWPPPPGLIRKRALELAHPTATADAAWAEVCEQIHKVGSLRGMMDFSTGETVQPTWSDPMLGRIVEALGWEELCASDNIVADRAHFQRFWAEAVARQRTIDHLPPVAAAALAGRGVPALNLTADRELAS